MEKNNSQGMSILHYAADTGHEETLKQLLSEDPGAVNSRSRWSRETPLMMAARRNHVDICRELVEKWGADVHAEENKGNTALHLAAAEGSKQACQLLLEKKMDPDSRNHQGNTALHKAAKGGHFTVLQLLVTKGGADIEAKNDKGQTALDLALLSDTGEHQSTIEYLTKYRELKRMELEGRGRLKSSVSFEGDFSSHYVSIFKHMGVLGHGSFSIVFEARHRTTSFRYAVKRVPFLLEDDPLEKSRLLREAITLERLLNHPNIIRYFSTWEEQPPLSWQMDWDKKMLPEEISGTAAKVRLTDPLSFLYIQTELCRKETLEDWMRRNPSERDYSETLSIFIQLSSAVDYVHRKGYVHRDIKPSNIFFSKDTGEVKLGDFGLCKPMGQEDMLDMSMNFQTATTNRIMGSYFFMSLEQTCKKHYNNKVDIFSMGAMLLQALYSSADLEDILGLKFELIPDDFTKKHPKESQYIKHMVSRISSNRPNAHECEQELRCWQKSSNNGNSSDFSHDKPEMSPRKKQVSFPPAIAVAEISRTMEDVVNYHDENGDVLLHFSAACGSTSQVQLLLSLGARVDERNNKGATPLIMAAQNNHLRVCKMLLRNDASAKTQDEGGRSALHWAALHGAAILCRLLLEDGAAPVDITTKEGNTALHLAARNGHIEATRVLLEKGAGARGRNGQGKTPFELAVRYGNSVVAEFLREYCGEPLDTTESMVSLQPDISTEEPQYKSRYSEEFEHLACLSEGPSWKIFKAKFKLTGNEYAVHRIKVLENSDLKEHILSDVCKMESLQHQNVLSYYNAWVESPPEWWQQDWDEFMDSSVSEEKISTESASCASVEESGDPKEGTPHCYVYVQSELCLPETLGQRLYSGLHMSREIILSIIKDIGSGLSYLHKNGFAHRNLHSWDVLFSAVDNHVKIDGLGLCSKYQASDQMASSAEFLSHSLHKASELCMSQEEASGEVLDQQSNTFSTAIIFYDMLAPFGENIVKREEVLQDLKRGELPKEFEEKNPRESILIKHMLRRTEDEFLSGEQIIRDIEDLIKQENEDGKVDAADSQPERDAEAYSQHESNAEADYQHEGNAEADNQYEREAKDDTENNESDVFSDDTSTTKENEKPDIPSPLPRFLSPQQVDIWDACRNGRLDAVKAWAKEHGIGEVLRRKDHRGNSLVHVAARKGHESLMVYLLGLGAQVDSRNWHDLTPLHYATQWDHKQLVSLLLDHGADVKAEDKDGDRPIHGAATWGHCGVVAMLLDRGTQVDCRGWLQRTPLHHAARWGRLPVLRLLLQRGASPSAKDDDGMSPRQLALKERHREVAILLKEHEEAEAKRNRSGH